MKSEKQLDSLLVNKALHDYIEYPWVRCYLALLRKSVKRRLIESESIFSKKMPGFLRENWDKIEKKTLLDPFRLGKLLDLVDDIKDLEGDIVECGSYKGGSGLLMGLMIQKLGINKKVHLFDSFEGLPDPDEIHDKGYKKGQFLSNYEDLQSTIESLGLTDIVKLHKGWFSETIPAYLSQYNPEAVSLFHIDCDLYTSTMDCFPSIFPLMVNDSIVVLDDYNDGGRGEKKAIKEVLYELNSHQMIYVSYGSQVYFYKGRSEIGENIVEDGLISYNLNEVFNNQAYLTWLSENIEEDYLAKFKTI